MKVYKYEAVVIGSGCAGYNCADWLFDFGVKNIAVVTAVKTEKRIQTGRVSVRPIPERKLWFEKIWNSCKELERRKQK